VSAPHTVALSDVAQINPPLPTQLAPDATVAFMPMSHVSADSATVTEQETRTYREVAKGYTPFVSGDVLVAKSRPALRTER
jgi:type I restriction enzyme, S subunit